MTVSASRLRPSCGRFINLATRGKIESGARDNGGLFHPRQWPPSPPVRRVGPTIQSFGLAGAIGESAVRLYDSASNLLLTNDGWW